MLRAIRLSLVVLLSWLSMSAMGVAESSGEKLCLDMVHHNPGEPLFDSQFNDPKLMKNMGYNGKVFFLFESATLAVDWREYEPSIKMSQDEIAWTNAKKAAITQKYAQAKAAGLSVYCMSDLILLPKSVIKHYNIDNSFGDISQELTASLLRGQLELMFRQFPDLDGIVVRIGETYLHDAPFHRGSIKDKENAKTIIALMQILQDEVCIKLDKTVIFRTWYSFDVDQKTYDTVSAAIEPHKNLYISVKHCEGDFQRGNRFSKVLGTGRHKQIVEVQCQREYDGKGAYPSYIAAGVIDGFEEYKYMMKPDEMQSLREVAATPNFSGIWTWTRGGGWTGPYISKGYAEIWCKLNAGVMSTWIKDTSRSEEDVFKEYVEKEFGLTGNDLKQFHKLALLSADAIIRGRRDLSARTDCWWTRDQSMWRPRFDINWPTELRTEIIRQKHESEQLWGEIVTLADSINFPDPGYADAVRVSARYGQRLYRIIRIGFDLANLTDNINGNRKVIDKLIAEYDIAWADYKQLKADNPVCASLYTDLAGNSYKDSLREFVDSLRIKPEDQ
ncbi:MAG: hypothetical protein JW745_01955 [Sedimentisphaerales bacterium]|nr:hypothetical protein [Sedimentisphaerales bacterium]MBN2843538.1 hypothetical protein [Sedimentisphaerales bacterium]